ncbi:hypothetical protein GH714_001908 [Hevea brasiliensis]|uniref:USP domain-containing protein n=1 Tax=Hevea brasiliensis TaxID=3981 RepID=A0A6A6KFH0_HEVBR|nr:hypothetical protein GH714_001908 [Hevea brasiliensis]
MHIEFLRLLVASMQSICLEGLGVEDKVKYLRCHHESERYENMMDLTLEIFGWVESLEDALTQFTTPEELDGENMRLKLKQLDNKVYNICPSYKAIEYTRGTKYSDNCFEALPGRKYGKISKCITFPDMLDMIPFMTGTEDIPPLYMLYAVVVHLDTLNASFSGHYVAYVKDLQGNCSCSYFDESGIQGFGSWLLDRTQKPSRKGHGKSSGHFLGSEPSLHLKPENGIGLINYTNGILGSTNRNVAQAMEFSDATSSGWSLSASSDEASFTTESTSDSFGTVDYTDACNADTFSSIFSNLYAPVVLVEHSVL